MKLLAIAAAACLFSSLLAAQTTTSFRSTAESATVIATANGTQVSVDVFRGDALGAPSTFVLTFSSTTNPDGSFTETFGSGNIPNEDFSTGGTEHMSLNVDTSQVSGFQSTTCTFTFTPFFQSSCSAGPLGVIHVDWVNNKLTSRQLLAEQHRTIGGSVIVHGHTDADEVSADATGSFFGMSFSRADSAFIDMNRDTSITITR